jgi:hypothetical protein
MFKYIDNQFLLNILQSNIFNKVNKGCQSFYIVKTLTPYQFLWRFKILKILNYPINTITQDLISKGN